MSVQAINRATEDIMGRHIRRGNLFIYQVMNTSDYIELDIQYHGSSYRDSDLRDIINEAGRIASSYGVRMKWGVMQAL